MFKIELSDDQIVFFIATFWSKHNRVDHLDEIEDYVVRNYKNQILVFKDNDGNNINLAQFREWLTRIQKALSLPAHKIVFNTQIKPICESTNDFLWTPCRDYYKICTIDNDKNIDVEHAKFVGCLNAGRLSMPRIRMTYELGQTFANNAFLTGRAAAAVDKLEKANAALFANEIAWYQSYQFYNDIVDNLHTGALNAFMASKNYADLWTKFCIEVVCETDEYMSQRLTDKVAKPLASGKPFLLLCGPGSLQHLRRLGFVTWSDFLDESYDNCQLPTQRIQKIITSLQQLYHRPDRHAIINQMYQHARHNANIYQSITEHKDQNNIFYTEFPRNY